MALMRWYLTGKCPFCGKKAGRGAKFCPHCGKATPPSETTCPNETCGAKVSLQATFCPKCGTQLLQFDTWRQARGRDKDSDFARRIEAAELAGALAGQIVVEPGVQVLIFQGGKLAAAAGEGTYDLKRPLGDVDPSVPSTAVLLDAGDVTLPATYADLRTSEDLAVSAEFNYVVRLGDAQALFTNLMHGRDSVSKDDVARILTDQSANLVQARVARTSVKDLKGNLELKQAMEDDLREGLSAPLGRSGLQLVHLQLVQFSGEAYEKVRDARGRTFVHEEMTTEAERRAALNRRVRELLTRERMAKLSSEKDFEDFVRQAEHEAGVKGVIRQAELDELTRTYADKKDDAETARKHLLEKLELEHELAVARIGWTGEAEKLDHQVEARRKALAAQQEAEWSEAQHAGRVADLQRDQALKDEQAKLSTVKDKAELGMKLRDQRISLDDAEERKRIERGRTEAEIAQDAADREAQRDLNRIKALSDVEQARLAADLRKTEAMKDLSEQQILAMMAEKSPHVAAALAERYRAQAQTQAAMSEETKALYERLIAAKDSDADRLERLAGRAMESVERAAGAAAARHRDHGEEVKDLAGRSMDRMADVAAARAGAPAAGRDEKAAVVCPNCKRQAPAGAKFCDNCGHQFYD